MGGPSLKQMRKTKTQLSSVLAKAKDICCANKRRTIEAVQSIDISHLLNGLFLFTAIHVGDGIYSWSVNFKPSSQVACNNALGRLGASLQAHHRKYRFFVCAAKKPSISSSPTPRLSGVSPNCDLDFSAEQSHETLSRLFLIYEIGRAHV